MNIQIITSSYPANPDDPSGTAGLFVRQFAIELAAHGHKVVVQPAARKTAYQPDPGISIVPTPWQGGDQELASMKVYNPWNWLIFIHFFIMGIKNTLAITDQHAIDRTLCMWAVPSGIFGLAGKKKRNIPYDVWVLGSDIWKIRKIPVLGRMLLGRIMQGADRVYADGLQLCRDVTELTGVPCEFLASSRQLPQPQKKLSLSGAPGIKHFLFVGRYHVNKGPDLLLQAVALLPEETRAAIRVHMFGLGPMEAELKQMALELKLEETVLLNGPIQAQEMADYLDSVSYLVIPSRIESIPLVFSDALQRGTPVVAMPVGDLEKIIKEFSCGFVAQKVSAKALAHAIMKATSKAKASYKEDIAKAYCQFDLKNAAFRWLMLKSSSQREQ